MASLERAMLEELVFSDSWRLYNDLIALGGDDAGDVAKWLQLLQNDCRPPGTRSTCGAEFYRWLGLGGWLVRANTAGPELLAHSREFPLLVIGQLIASNRCPHAGRVRVHCDALGRVTLPQAERALITGLSPYEPLEFEWSRTGLVFRRLRRKHVVSIASIRRMIDRSENSPTLDRSDIYLRQRGQVLAQVVTDLSVVASTPVEVAEDLRVWTRTELRQSPGRRTFENLSTGAALVRTAAPAHWEEIRAVMDAITLVHGRRFVGSSDIWYHGVMFLNPAEEWTPITFADHLVHEGAHILLHASNELAPILRNPDQLGAPSPIRKDPRPLYGVFHSTFVFMRLCQFFERVVECSDEEEALFRFHRHLLGFYEGMAAVERFADFTESGRVIFDAMVEEYWRFRSNVREPDPEKYKRAGRDYIL